TTPGSWATSRASSSTGRATPTTPSPWSERRSSARRRFPPRNRRRRLSSPDQIVTASQGLDEPEVLQIRAPERLVAAGAEGVAQGLLSRLGHGVEAGVPGPLGQRFEVPQHPPGQAGATQFRTGPELGELGGGVVVAAESAAGRGRTVLAAHADEGTAEPGLVLARIR